jgi:hypothetical protein
MSAVAAIVGLCLALQVPPPSTETDPAASLKGASRTIQERETRELEALAARLAAKGNTSASGEIKRLVPALRPRDGATRVTALPQVVPSRDRGLASVNSQGRKPGEPDAWHAEVERIRSRSASELLALARKAAASNPTQMGLAAMTLRQVLDRQPDHAEARRLLGYVPHEGGWARPFAVSQFKMGNVDDPVFGWVPRDWVGHLKDGELPAPTERGQKTVRWIPAAEADQLRSAWRNPWRISTEHFDILSDAPLNEAVEFARRLEAFYGLFFTIMADAVGDNLPLARRFHSPTLTADANYRPHQVYYFRSKEEYVEHLRPAVGPEIEQTLGYYDPPRAGRGNRAPAYFFRDLGGQLPVTATLYHEVSHQLLFETAGPNAYTRNVGNYWVFEGLGTYFETVSPQEDGSLEVGGLVGERIAAARRSLAEGSFEPLEDFLRLDQNAFNRPDRIHAHYQQAMALATFLMQWNDGAYRAPFLEYVRDAYRGRIKRNSGRSLEDRLGQTAPALEAQFRGFLSAEP